MIFVCATTPKKHDGGVFLSVVHAAVYYEKKTAERSTLYSTPMCVAPF